MRGRCLSLIIFFFFNDTATTEIYTLSLHDALPIYRSIVAPQGTAVGRVHPGAQDGIDSVDILLDRKSTRLNSSHVRISYAVFCLKKKNNDPLTFIIIRVTDSRRITIYSPTFPHIWW